MNDKVRIAACLLGMVLAGLQTALVVVQHVDNRFRLYSMVATSGYIILAFYSLAIHLIKQKKRMTNRIKEDLKKIEIPVLAVDSSELLQKSNHADDFGTNDDLGNLSLQERWIKAMAKEYCDRWYEAFQCLPTSVEDKNQLNEDRQRRLCYEIALQTIDFLRMEYDCGRFVSVMGNNPLRLLGETNVPDALPFSTDPFQTPKEVRAIFQLLWADGIEEMPVTIHGYLYKNEEQK